MGPTAAAIGGVGSPTVPPPMGGAPVAPPMGGGNVTGVAVGPALQPGAADPPQQPTVAQAIPRPSDQGTVYQDSYVSFLNQTPGTAFLIFLFPYVLRVFRFVKYRQLIFENLILHNVLCKK
nr:unnamed protein product [Callosobruchus analis]